MKKRIIKPFDLAKAKAGAEICTRDGRKARIICFDAVGKDYHIISLIANDNGEEDDFWHMNDGRCYKDDVDDFDLMLVEYEEKQHQFKPFEKVLVRCEDGDVWMCDIFSHCSNTINLPFVCVGARWGQCIPYDGNKNLIGTTNNPE